MDIFSFASLNIGRHLMESITVTVWTQLDSVTEMDAVALRRGPETTLFCHFFNRERCGFQKVLKLAVPATLLSSEVDSFQWSPRSGEIACAYW